MVREVGEVFVFEAEGEGGEAWRETPFSQSTFRVDSVNKQAMSNFTCQLEKLRADGQAEEGVGSHVPQRRRLPRTDITCAWLLRSYTVHIRTEILSKCDTTPVTPRGHHPSFAGDSVMTETQQSTRAGRNVSMSSAREEGQSMPPKTEQAGVSPHEMYEVNNGGLVTILRVDADTRDNHGFAPPADVVLTYIRVVHVAQESETERPEIEYGRGVLLNLEYHT
jgi:hypothetical protein